MQRFAKISYLSLILGKIGKKKFKTHSLDVYTLGSTLDRLVEKRRGDTLLPVLIWETLELISSAIAQPLARMPENCNKKGKVFASIVENFSE